MKKFFKWAAISLGSLIILIVIVLGIIVISLNGRLSKTYNITTETFTAPNDSASIANGQRLAFMHCAGCHGDNFGGMDIINNDDIGKVSGANITSGKGGKVANYKDADWVRSVRHGVDPSGRPLFVMPSKEFYHLNDDDLGDIVAYLRTVPPVNNDPGMYRLTLLSKILATFGAFGTILHAEAVDHTAKRPTSAEPAETSKYGLYIAKTSGCFACHGDNLKGAKDPNPEAPPSPNITNSGNFGKWNFGQFAETIRTGKTPEGKLLSKFMPWKHFSRMNETELKALYLYIKSI
jgi:mono/diheme cytochrome c family protein